MVETGVTLSCTRGTCRIDLVQIAEHGLHRRMQAVKIESIKADLFAARRQVVVVCPQPPDKIEHVRISPHPGWKTIKPCESIDCVRVVVLAFNVSVYPVGIGKVCLDGDSRKVLFRNEPLCDLGTFAIELMRPVRCFADEYETA